MSQNTISPSSPQQTISSPSLLNNSSTAISISIPALTARVLLSSSLSQKKTSIAVHVRTFAIQINPSSVLFKSFYNAFPLRLGQ
ncbi:hypothetical protein M378DRAFT_13189 [Amanita muscaria Koide BX008]|uniref:Uncharacterized protein n=1 Tax=Amanita muscaria (strain Koide BX008) TaxID=946122 RepID=A0A0C2WZJ3_AMAMK|nr:hypothetical protein M378DRAFT_13189 [Amanita muscaria Koide BX008]